uniref:Uncharacterized protein n=1 Tax=Rhizophagus irregularis (strain DAOM 181602 / DAOM 197198 / MUCL 43194) TaxID=747089 RepID=U9SVV8_RHIID
MSEFTYFGQILGAELVKIIVLLDRYFCYMYLFIQVQIASNVRMYFHGGV